MQHGERTRLDVESLRDAGPLLILAMVILVGVAFGAVVRRIHLPAITGQILAGIVLGRAGLDLFGESSLQGLEPLTHFALGLMSVTVGAHLNLRRLRNAGRRLIYLLILEATVTPFLVLAVVLLFDPTSPGLAVLLAATAISTAPATIVAIVKEARAKGVFVKTLIAAVALNNLACIVCFEVARAVVKAAPGSGSGFVGGLVDPIAQLLMAAGIGGGVALAMNGLGRFVVRPDRLATAAVVALMLTVGLARILDVSPLLACLLLGFVQTNLTRTRDQLVDAVFANFEPAILAVFFTLAGMHLSLEHAGLAGLLAVAYMAARLGGKLVAADLAMRLAHATDRVRRNLGLALVPQAGVAVGLVVLLQEDPAFAGTADIFGAVVLTVVTANEIVGPILARLALTRSGEAGRDRVRLIDFIHEENIVTEFRAETKEAAIEKLVDLMIRTQHLEGIDREELLASVLERERQASTCLGGGLSVPHGILPGGHPMVGVMALTRSGLTLPTPDGRPVHCMVLLGTSSTERDRHLEVLAALARSVGGDPAFQAQLFAAKSPAHAYEVLHGEESEAFNYFLEGEG